MASLYLKINACVHCDICCECVYTTRDLLGKIYFVFVGFRLVTLFIISLYVKCLDR